MLRQGAGGQPLDAPPPIPTPIEPARAKRRRRARRPRRRRRRRRAATTIDDGPTNIGGPAGALRGDPDRRDGGPRSPRGHRRDHRRATTARRRMRRVAPAESRAPPPDCDPPRRQRASAPADGPDGAAAAQGAVRAAAAPAADAAAGVRPRVIGGAKQVNAAADALRAVGRRRRELPQRSAHRRPARGPGVRVPDSEFDIKPDRRWGRSAGRTFVLLFVAADPRDPRRGDLVGVPREGEEGGDRQSTAPRRPSSWSPAASAISRRPRQLAKALGRTATIR
jgi:hypothetical protein